MSKKQSGKETVDKLVRNISDAPVVNSMPKRRYELSLPDWWRGSVAELCRKEGIHQNLYYRWSRSSGSW